MTDIDYDERLDVSGKSCPIPIVKSRSTLKELEEGQVLLTVSTDSGSESDFTEWADGSDDVKLLDYEEKEEEYRFYIEKV